MTQEEIQQKHAIQREFLHDAATWLELDPHDEVIYQGDYCLVFDSHRQALAVARHAVKSWDGQFDDKFHENRTKPVRSCSPAIILYAGNGISGKYLAVMDFEKD